MNYSEARHNWRRQKCRAIRSAQAAGKRSSRQASNENVAVAALCVASVAPFLGEQGRGANAHGVRLALLRRKLMKVCPPKLGSALAGMLSLRCSLFYVAQPNPG
jgi:hypothetical protein